MVRFPEDIYSEFPAIKLLQSMGYTYLPAAELSERSDITEMLLLERLRTALVRLNPDLDAANINRAVNRLSSVTGSSLMEINQKIHELLRGGKFNLPQKKNGKEDFVSVHFIDFAVPENNDFLVVNQMRYAGKGQNSVPDLMIYLNGLPVVLIECKSPDAGTPWDKAFGDLVYYQHNSERLFYCNQILIGIWRHGGRYGAIDAEQKYFSVYRPGRDEDLSFLGEDPTAQDILLYGILRKERLLDIIRHYVIFETTEGVTVKKLPRYQQMRAADKAVARLQSGKGGVVWHTQGSGKSITMAYLTRKLRAPEYGFGNPTIMVLTDRNDLDRQITDTFRNVGFSNVTNATSVAHLDSLLRNSYGGIITTTIHKFQEPGRGATDSDQTAEEENENLRIERSISDGILTKITRQKRDNKWVEIAREELVLEQLSAKEDVYVLVDEAHRSQYGFLAAFMRTILPQAKFVAFTGTPISNEDKSTLGEFYGGDYIDVYTIKESVADGATVELLYDAGICKMDVRAKELDEEFQETYGDASAEKQDKLKRQALREYLLSESRIEEICRHLVAHFASKIRPDGHKAMIVCSGRTAAVKYQKMLHKLQEEGIHDFKSQVVLSLGSPKTDKIAQEHFEILKHNRENPKDSRPEWVVSSEKIKEVTNNFKLPYPPAYVDENVTDKSGTNKLYNNTAFLIVSDMLLTGYDVPIASCLYLDKSLKEHNLLQAIARVNRSGKGKKAGFIVDYNGITAYLLEALEIFSGDIRPDDILKNLTEEIPVLKMNHSKMVDFFRRLNIDRISEEDRYIDAAVRYIEPLDRRDEFKVLLKGFNKSINIVLPNPAAIAYEADFKLYNLIKATAKDVYVGDDELKISANESLLLQQMIDKHLKARGVTNLLEEPVSIFEREKLRKELDKDSEATRELKMRNKLKHTIKVGLDKNPDFYQPLAQRLDNLLKEKEAKRIDEAQLLLAYAEVTDAIVNANKEAEAMGFDTEQKREVYKTMQVLFRENAEDATNAVFDMIAGELNLVDWQNKERVKNDMERKINRSLKTLGMSREEAREKAVDIVKIMEKN